MKLMSDTSALDVLCPMHLLLDAGGRIIHAGPTIQKVCESRPLVGECFFDVFEVKRPRAFTSMSDMKGALHRKLHLNLQAKPHPALKGVMVAAGGQDGQMIVNLSFGISIVEGVREFSLTNADFAATELAIEMLYLVEANTAAMGASYRLNSKLQGAKIAAEEQAFTDTLTGLKNRRALDTILTRLLGQGQSFAVMQIDLDFFKAVNDSFGHAAGDFVLQSVAHIMVQQTRKQDMVARVGGDEFTIVLPDIRRVDVLRQVGNRLITEIEEPINFRGHECRISASIGTVWIQKGERPKIEDLLVAADDALYASKRAGRALQTFYSFQQSGEVETVPRSLDGGQDPFVS